jgi:hypothetical protein
MLKICNIKKFVAVSALILAGAGLLKLISASQEVASLTLPSFFLVLSNRQMMLLAGMIELLCVLYISLGKDLDNKVLLIAWLSSCFLVYRLGLLWTKFPTPCHCLGNALDWLPLDKKLVDSAMGLLVVMMICVSYSLIILKAGKKIEY